MPTVHTPRAPIGYVLYQGPSVIDGAPIVVIYVPAKRASNRKTGEMGQTYIFRADIPPMEASRIGADASVCGGCVHRGKIDRESGKLVGRSCYVTLFQGPRVVWDAWQRGRYQDITDNANAIALVGSGQLVRLGTYGDPASVPIAVWDALLSQSAGHTGYSHQWRAPRLRAVMRYCQASCDTPADVAKASELGYGIFYVAPTVTDVPDGFLRCPASAEAGKTATCADCLMCDGKGNRIVIAAHGAGATHVARRSLPVLS